MGLRIATVVVALALAASATGSTGPLQAAASYLVSVQQPDGGFAESGRPADTALTAWAALGLVAAGAGADARAGVLAYLRAHDDSNGQITDVALVALARVALGDRPETLLARLSAVRAGPLLNAEMWTVLALQLGRGFPFDVAHAAGNLALAVLAGPELRRVLERYDRQLHTEVAWT